ncbi:VanZ family protein [Virgibacillus oceani]|uniref:VanZ family protein n=1 Tax=Virgibacillus oceani TaxID=1479511 RepID=A0A917H4V1_9BACI|nr:VanZ family protein [Virgibacillus oceani]GGG67463.1 VanZ family protein [Virgibacillus oceani]
MQKYLYWLLPIFWMGIIFYSSATPYEDQDIKPLLSNSLDLSFLVPLFDWISFSYHHSEVSIDALGIAGFMEFFFRKGAHFTVFFVLACLLFIAIGKTTEIGNRITLFISFLVSVAYAGIDELHQGFTANRTPYVGDVIIDAFGGGTACLLLFLYVYKYGNLTTQKE